MVIGKLLQFYGLRLGTVKWRGVMKRAQEGGVAYFVRQTPKEDDSSRIQECPPPHFKSAHAHTWLSNSISFNESWLDSMSKLFGSNISLSSHLPLSLWASLLSSRRNSVERHLQASLLKRVIRVWNNGADAQIQCFVSTAQLESDVLGFSINWNLKWTARGKCYCSEDAKET